MSISVGTTCPTSLRRRSSSSHRPESRPCSERASWPSLSPYSPLLGHVPVPASNSSSSHALSPNKPCSVSYGGQAFCRPRAWHGQAFQPSWTPC
eukprot:scaffold64569_cov34-Phaeocystis_antarctica.AAC.1